MSRQFLHRVLRIPRVRSSAVALTTSLLIAASALGASATPAAAAVSLTNGAYAGTSIACSQSMDWMRRTVTMRPQSRYSSQPAAWRSYIQPAGSTAFWTAWTSATAPFQTTYVVSLAGTNLTAYMQYAWWNGSSWFFAGEWIGTYAQVQGASIGYLTYCAT